MMLECQKTSHMLGKGFRFPCPNMYPCWLLVMLVPIAVGLPLSRSFSLRAEVWDVPEEMQTLSEALQIAQPYDTVLVSPGTYDNVGSLFMDAPSVILLGEDSLRARINLGALYIRADSCVVRGLSFMNWIDFPITVGAVTGTQIRGNAFLWSMRAIDDQGLFTSIIGNYIMECWESIMVYGQGGTLIASNELINNGGGILLWAPATVKDNEIIGTTSGSDVGAPLYGGGVGAFSVGGQVLIQNNTIDENTCDTWEPLWVGKGGGIYTFECDSVIIEHNTITNNQALLGGGIYVKDSNVEIRENFIRSNVDTVFYEEDEREGLGGGFWIGNCEGVIENNTIIENNAHIDGAAFYLEGNSTPVIRNNIWASNISRGSGVYCTNLASSPIFECNNAWANGIAEFGGSCPDPTGTNGNFSADPLFCWPEGDDFYLHADSPCAPENSPAGCGLIGAFPASCGISGVDGWVANDVNGLIRSYPNPMKTSSTIILSGDHSFLKGEVRILDILGRCIRSFSATDVGSGDRTFHWDGRSSSGELATPGLYFIRAKSGDSMLTSKIMVVR
ncbi:MAG: right-handed parallel beta-helix repeat-containing protein [Candidatus Eisenbacteria bacterium]|nr:right-handed parallel beta-helix repeat-containing protein [Candidatus Eisenbacteria bacterium]